jgi:hypothetical protein
MHVTFSASLIVRIAAGTIFILSCGDDSPSQVDAATCDCPAAEPPIAGRIMVVDQVQTIAANNRGGQSAKCPEGALRLSGSCTTATINPGRDVTLEQSGFYDASDHVAWNCLFKNNEAAPVTIKASVTCLLPPGS